MNKQEREPRKYQLELLEYVTHRNAIIYLPTGAGKTFVAVMAIKRFSHKLQEAIENGGKRAIFMCNTIELARQQAIELKQSTNLKIGYYVGERDTDNWTRNKWNEEITENQVLVGTVQIFVDIVSQNFIRINDLSIVVIDECHHATGGHPMLSFMRLFERADQADLPRVIGLTGVLIKGNKLHRVEQDLVNLEAAFRGNIITVNSMEEFQNVLIYSTKPAEEFVFYSTAGTKSSTELQIIDIMTNTITLVEKWQLGTIPVKYSKNLGCPREPSKKSSLKNLFKDFLHQMEDFGLFTASFAIESVIIELELKKRSAETMALRNLYRTVVTQCEYIRRLIVKRLMDTVDESDSSPGKFVNMEAIQEFSTSKMLSFLTYLERKFTGKSYEEICSLVFVQRRYTAKCVFFVVKAFIELNPNLRDSIKAQFMVGRNASIASVESLLEQKWNRSAVEDFRKGKCNLIICSNVLEEGIDLQGCSYVCSLDPLKTFNSYIQTKGRARRNDATYTIFAAKSDQDKICEQLHSYRKTHEFIKNFLVGRVLDREDPTEDEIANRFACTIPPFQIPSGAVLLASSALSLLHRYCQTLPNDSFVSSTPWYTVSGWKNGKVTVSINLPLQSTVRETIVSDPMETVKAAKVSAAFKACQRLYENNELNEKLLPVTKQECIALVSADLFNHWKKYNDKATTRTSKQYRRLYDRMCPKELYEAMPVVGQKCYAYEITVTPLFEKNPYNEHIVKYLNGSSNYGILLNKKLPKLANMPLFMNQGKLNVKIMNEPLEIILTNESELQKLIGFHVMLFRDLLKCWKQFFVIDRRNKQNSFLLTPLNRQKGTIDWPLVERFQHLDPVRKYTVAERESMVFRPEDYVDTVVQKWYGELNRSVFIVTNVRTDKTPLTAFPTTDYKNYGNYMEQKYGNEIGRIVNKEQFLLEVRQLSDRRNFYNNAAGKAKAINKHQDVITLIPETCCNLKFPAELWLKAIFLPSILSRLHFMLHAEELRLRIDRFLGFPNNLDYNPKPVMIDTSLRRAMDLDGNVIEDIEEEPRKVLSSLVNATSKQNTFDNSTLTENVGWKDYLEPCDFSRKAGAVHSVELNYYYNFVSGLTMDFKELKLDDDELWTKSQLQMPSPKKVHNAAGGNSPKLALTCGDTTNDYRCHINILERSLGGAPLGPAEQFEYLAAITTSTASDVFDMERFELLGDSFLKFATSLFLANKYSSWHEGFYTEVKSKFVSNRNLLYLMLDTDIPNRISGTLFKPNFQGCWLPPLVSIPNNLLARFQENDIVHSTLLTPELYNLELTEEQIRDGNCTESQVQRFVQVASKFVKPSVEDAEEITDNYLNGVFYKQSLSDKVVSDTLEALLGVCVKNYGIYHGFRMLEFFGLCRPQPGKSLTDLLQLNLNSSLLRTNISPKEVDGFLVNHEILEDNLGYTFKDRSFLLQALTHPSYPTNRITGCYQVLEFIGDAILDFMVSSYIFEQHASMTPGKLTDLRSALVNNITLACVCVRHRFHLYILAENAVLSETIRNFEKFQEKMNHRTSEQVHILMEENDIRLPYQDEEDGDEEDVNDEQKVKPFNLAVNVDVPKALGDVVEALIAAVFLDSRDLRTTWNVIYKLLQQEFNDFAQNVPIDAVRRLHEHKHADPNFSKAIVDDNNAVMVKCEFTCLNKRVTVNGFGSNSTQAKKAAAKHALQILDRHTD